ncbi:hypothetical protein Btru_067563 [Bulinus truncatus]|nr:hypothetical protein Btru_067563 [Bulinus truncatus]
MNTNISNGKQLPDVNLHTCQQQPNNYRFRADDGFSASVGARRRPLVFPTSAMDSVLNPQLFGVERPTRVLPKGPVSWWPVVSSPVCYRKKPEPGPRYIGLHYDITRPPPTEYELKNF